MSVPVGHGLPWWLDTDEFMSADETREWSDECYYGGEYNQRLKVGTCANCKEWKMLQKAHIVRVGSSHNRKRHTDGPKVGLCWECHTTIDQHQASMTMAVRRSTKDICVVYRDGTSKVVVPGWEK